MKKALVKFTILCALVLYNCIGEENDSSKVIENKTVSNSAPELKLEGIYNKPDKVIPTLKSLRGKVVVLDFWAIWCSPCVAAFPENNRIYEKYKDDGVEYIAITDDPKEKLENFLKKVDVKFWIGRDDDKQEFKNYQITARPHIYIINREGNIVFEGYSINENLVEEVLATNFIATKKDIEISNVITDGGFSPGQDPLFNAVDIMLNRNKKEINYRPNPKLINHFIIRPSLNKEWGGHGWNQSRDHKYYGITYYGGKLENIFQFLNDLSSPIWVKNNTKDTTLYDIVYWKKSPSLHNSFKEIQENLLDGLSMNFEKSRSLQNVNKLVQTKKNIDVLAEDGIISGTQKAYTPINTFITQLEKKSKEYYTLDKSLEKTFIYNKGMEWKKLNSSTLDELTYFLKEKNINVSKVKEEIEIFEIYNN